jgi:trehalose-6-phosphatase
MSGADIEEAQNRIAQAMSAGNRVALFLDYDGTLREIEREPSLAKPTPALHDFLKRLTDLAKLTLPLSAAVLKMTFKYGSAFTLFA